jgi:hypothetical protein
MRWKVGGRDSEKDGRSTVDGRRREEKQESDAKASGRRATTGEASPGAMCLATPHLKAGLDRPNTRTSERSEGQRGWPVSCVSLPTMASKKQQQVRTCALQVV